MVALALRAGAAAVAPLIDDEAYYWLWAHHLALGYLDHPPMIAYLVFLTTRVGDAPLLIRLGPLILGGLTAYTLFLLGREMFGIRAGVIAAVLFQLVPVLSGGGLLATPDAPLFLAWAVALRFAWQAMHGRPRRWLPAGLAVGAGLLSKFPMVFLPAGLALYVMTRSPGWLRRRDPYLAVLVAAAIFSPVVVWNAQHDWAGLRFVLAERRSATPDGVTAMGRLAVEQLAFVLPLVFAFVWALVRSLRHGDERFAFLGWSSLPALLFPFVAAYVGAWPHGNWLGPGYLALCIALAALWNRAAAVLAAVNGAIVLYGLSATLVPALPLLPGAEEVYGWREAGARVRVELARLGPDAVILADRYQIAAQLAYHARPAGATLLPCPHPASIWPGVEMFAGSSAIAVIDQRWEPVVRWEQYAAAVEEAPPLAVSARGRALRTFRIYRLRALQTRGVCPSGGVEDRLTGSSRAPSPLGMSSGRRDSGSFSDPDRLAETTRR